DDGEIAGEINPGSDDRENGETDERHGDRVALADRLDSGALEGELRGGEAHDVHLAAGIAALWRVVPPLGLCRPVTVASHRKRLSHEPYEASLEMSAIFPGRSCRKVLTVGELSARLVASRCSWVMSSCSGARPTCS